MSNALEDKGYSPQFVKRILESKKSIEAGNYTEIKDTKDIWSNILSD